jgi:hypothetical protein
MQNLKFKGEYHQNWFNENGIVLAMINDHERNQFYEKILQKMSKIKIVLILGLVQDC